MHIAVISSHFSPILVPAGYDLRTASRHLPERPGVYLMCDSTGDVVYIGKAVNLRKRVGSYTTPSASKDRKVGVLVGQIASLSFIETSSELEALLVESRLIKHLHPAFNRRLLEPESFCFLRLTVGNGLPRIEMVSRSDGGFEHIGPIWSSSSAYVALDGVSNVFRLSRCSKYKNGRTLNPQPRKSDGGMGRWGGPDSGLPLTIDHRPSTISTIQGEERYRECACLIHEFGKCSGPCSGEIGQAEYEESVLEAWDSLTGKSDTALLKLLERRERLSDELRFEDALAVHGQIWALEQIRSISACSLDNSCDFAVVAASHLKHRPVVLLFSHGRLADKLVASPRLFPDVRMLANRLKRMKTSAKDLLPGVPSGDDLLIIRSYLQRRRNDVCVMLLDSTIDDTAGSLHALVDSLRGKSKPNASYAEEPQDRKTRDRLPPAAALPAF